MEDIQIREVSIDEIIRVSMMIPEFDDIDSKTYFEERIKGKEALAIAAYIDRQPVGYLIGYDRYNDGSFYCWMAGVDPIHRRKGVLKALMKYEEYWVKRRGYNKIRIKTRNNRRAMRSYLANQGFNVTGVEVKEDSEDNRISLEKMLWVSS